MLMLIRSYKHLFCSINIQFHICKKVGGVFFVILTTIFLQEIKAERMRNNFVGARIVGFLPFFSAFQISMFLNSLRSYI